jgi:HNH endonuclease
MHRIRIIWPGTRSIETVSAPLNRVPQDNEIRQTAVYYITDDKLFPAITTSSRTKAQDGTHRILIHHAKENYTEDQLRDRSREFGEPDSWLWGTATITISRDLDSAQAVWEGANTDRYDGKGQCAIFSQGLFKAHERDVITRWKREQARFKQSLRESGGNCCVISGEKTPAALEAAHIVEVPNGGMEAPDNGILLRADIHRLYDARLFRIAQNGTIISISNELSGYYRELLQDKTISDEIVNRIKEALAKRARLQEGG